jgi:hypothetical protein
MKAMKARFEGQSIAARREPPRGIDVERVESMHDALCLLHA